MPPIYIGSSTELKSNHVQLPTASSNPSSPAAGDMYYNTSVNKIRLYDGSAWTDIG